MFLALKLYCIVLYCIVLYCIVLYCIVLYCIVLYCIVSIFPFNNDGKDTFSLARLITAEFKNRAIAGTI